MNNEDDKDVHGLTIVPAIGSELSPELSILADEATDYIRDSVAKNTGLAYKSDWKLFSTWCAKHGLDPLPASADTVILYIAALVKGAEFPLRDGRRPPRRPRTVLRHVATISTRHRTAGLPSPYDDELVRKALDGVCNRHGMSRRKRSAAIAEIIHAAVAATPTDLRGARDAAVLLLGFGGALRQSNIVKIDREHLGFEDKGVRLYLPWSKTDQRGEGRYVRIGRGASDACCPVAATQRWLAELDRLGVTDGAVFRSLSRGNWMERLVPEAVAVIVRRAVARTGADATTFSGHSLRAGHVTSAVRKGQRLDMIRQTTGHRRLENLLAYLEESGGWDDASSVGLL